MNFTQPPREHVSLTERVRALRVLASAGVCGSLQPANSPPDKLAAVHIHTAMLVAAGVEVFFFLKKISV